MIYAVSLDQRQIKLSRVKLISIKHIPHHLEQYSHSLKTNISPENWWLGDQPTFLVTHFDANILSQPNDSQLQSSPPLPLAQNEFPSSPGSQGRWYQSNLWIWITNSMILPNPWKIPSLPRTTTKKFRNRNCWWRVRGIFQGWVRS